MAAHPSVRPVSAVALEEALLDGAAILRALLGTPRNLAVTHQRDASSQIVVRGILLIPRAVQSWSLAPIDELLKNRPGDPRQATELNRAELAMLEKLVHERSAALQGNAHVTDG